MSGRIIFEPPTPTQCSLGRCGGKPDAKNYRDGTLWKCDDCGRVWEVWSGAQYNEPFSAWKVAADQPDGGA